MHDPARILIVDDNDANRDILKTRLKVHGYDLIEAADGEEALARACQHLPDLILLDVMMPKLDGIEVCRRLRAMPDLPFIPIILVTARTETDDVVAGLEAGADEYLTKPVNQTALVARVRSVLRTKSLHDQVQKQAADLVAWNSELETRVAAQVAEIERIGRLRRFLSPQIADLILSKGQEHLLDSHRSEVSIVFCDLRGFTAFSETAEPEEITAVLGEYYGVLGDLIHKYDGTLAHFAGDGVMVLFNDPVPCPDPCQRAVRMAVEMRDAVLARATEWRRYGHDLGFGIGIAHGHATLGCIGFENRADYSAIGSVVNLASRLCSGAASGQILIDGRVRASIGELAEIEAAADLVLKGFQRRAGAYIVRGLRP